MGFVQLRGAKWALALVCAVAVPAAIISVAAGDGSLRSTRGNQPSEATRPALLIGAGGPLGEFYSASSPFNRPIPPDPAIAPNSRSLVQGLAQAGRGGFVVALNRWTVPVYLANASTPRYRVALTAPWALSHSLSGVPIPSDARPDPSSDGQLTILNQQDGCEYDFWQAQKNGHMWTAAWGNSLRTSGPGVYPHGLSARGSGFALLAGLIWPQELISGRINHALMFSYPYTSGRGFVAPATETDGTSTRSDALPEGALLQLDPAFNVASLPPYERGVARALQRYGMYLGDTGTGDVSLYAISAHSYTHDPYALLTGGNYLGLENIPLTRFRVIRYGPLLHNGRTLRPSGCGRFG